MFRYDAARQGIVSRLSSNRFGGVRWRFQTGAAVKSSPVVYRGILYIGSNDGNLYAIDAYSGSRHWQFDAGEPIDSTPAVVGESVYFQRRDGALYALDARNGTLLWSIAAPKPMRLEWTGDDFSYWSSSPAVVDGTVFYGSIDGRLHAVTAASGASIWTFATGGRIQASPAVHGRAVYVGSFDGKFYAVDRSSGKAMWTFATRASRQSSSKCGFECRSIRSSPTISDGTIAFGARDGFLYALREATGTFVWSVDHKTSWINVSPVITRGLVYDGTSDTHLIEAFDLATGRSKWRFRGDGLMLASPTVAGDMLVEADFRGNVFALDARTGTLRWKYRGSDDGISSSPYVTADAIYYGSDDGTVTALNLERQGLERAVFYDHRYDRAVSYTKAGSSISPAELRDFLVGRGYEPIDERGLSDFLSETRAHGTRSVVVFATDYLPDFAAPSRNGRGLLRKYLDAGGKVVWVGFPPALWKRDLSNGTQLSVDPAPTQKLLGVRFDHNLETPLSARATAEGERWGLSGSLLTVQDAEVKDVSSVLALDEDGYAGAWTKQFTSQPGTGFVFLPPLDFDLVPDADSALSFSSIQQAAEYYPAR